MTNPDGTERGIPCDKIKIGELSWTMLKSKLAFLLGDDQIVEYRLWLALVPQFMHGLPGSDDALKASCSIANDAREGDVVKDFLAVYRFKSPTDEQGPSGSGQTPLLHAAMVGNVEAAAGLIAQGADVHCKIRKFDMATGMDAGGTALHMAVAACPVRHVEMVAVLLRAGADANVTSKSGVTPLMAGVGFHSFSGAKAFLECATDILDLERGHNTNGDTALGFATYAGTHELCEVLIQAGASRSNVTSTGGTKLHAVCQNVATTRSMLDLIWNEGELSINALYKPRRTFWILVFTYFQRGVKLGLIAKSQFAMEMAHSAGSTPLHFAAMNGLIGVIVWLLEHGAHKPLRIRNDMGSTPLDIARIFGPYPSIEAKLGATMLNNDFDTQFAIRRGSLLRRQTNGLIAEPPRRLMHRRQTRPAPSSQPRGNLTRAPALNVSLRTSRTVVQVVMRGGATKIPPSRRQAARTQFEQQPASGLLGSAQRWAPAMFCRPMILLAKQRSYCSRAVWMSASTSRLPVLTSMPHSSSASTRASIPFRRTTRDCKHSSTRNLMLCSARRTCPLMTDGAALRDVLACSPVGAACPAPRMPDTPPSSR